MSSSDNFNSRVCREIVFRSWSGDARHGLQTHSSIGYFLCTFSIALEKGWAHAVLLDKNRRVLRTVKLKVKSVPLRLTVTQEIDRAITREKKAKFLLVVHNHKGNPTSPSPMDITTTRIIADYYKDSSITFLGHYVISDFDYLCIKPDGIIHKSLKYIKENSGKA